MIFLPSHQKKTLLTFLLILKSLLTFWLISSQSFFLKILYNWDIIVLSSFHILTWTFSYIIKNLLDYNWLCHTDNTFSILNDTVMTIFALKSFSAFQVVCLKQIVKRNYWVKKYKLVRILKFYYEILLWFEILIWSLQNRLHFPSESYFLPCLAHNIKPDHLITLFPILFQNHCLNSSFVSLLVKFHKLLSITVKYPQPRSKLSFESTQAICEQIV